MLYRKPLFWQHVGLLPGFWLQSFLSGLNARYKDEQATRIRGNTHSVHSPGPRCKRPGYTGVAHKPQGRGWKQVGYSDIIHFNGKVTNLVPYNDNDIVEPWEITNGVRGINSRARHVVLPGGLDADGNYKDTRTAAQRLALANYIRQSIVQHPNIKWGGHYQFDAKKPFCPGWNVPEWLRTLGVPEKNIYNP